MLSNGKQLLVFNLLFSLKLISSTIWLRNPNERGPTAVNAGTKCLGIMSKYYFSNRRVTRTQNLGYLYSTNLSAPSTEIELHFLANVHEMIVKGEIDGLQLRVISDAFNINSLLNVDPRSVMLTDFYVIITDDFSKVYSIIERVAVFINFSTPNQFLAHMNNFVIKSSAWNPGARLLLLFNNPYLRQIGCNGTQIASKFFQTLYNKFKVANVVILYATGVKTYDVYVTNPYTNDHDCRKKSNKKCCNIFATKLFRNTQTSSD